MVLKTGDVLSRFSSDIAHELGLGVEQVQKTLKLLIVEECTVPFVARYRKEVTGLLDEVQLRDILDRFDYKTSLFERKESILRSISEQGKLSPELEAKILACQIKTELEDLYLPYKPKKRTKGQIARERGLAPLSEEILRQESSLTDLVPLFSTALDTHPDLKSLDIIVQGVKDILAEQIAELSEIRRDVRTWLFEHACFRADVREDFREKKTKYNNYYNFSEPVKSIAAHRLMALRRGEKEEILKLSLDFDRDTPLSLISNYVIRPQASLVVRNFLSTCILESYDRLILPSLETEIRLETKTKAEEEAIAVFAKNLRNLLLLPPCAKQAVLGVDPGLRTGSKLVVVDMTGQLLEYTTIYPDHTDTSLEKSKNKDAAAILSALLKKHDVRLVSIGNGTAGREMEAFVEKVIALQQETKIRVVVVNEAGASVYSASDLAREEFPDLDITYRGAVSIARRLQDPLAELVKIDPKNIGVGQYQHDVNQSRLKKQLGDVVESCVNFVGVNLNTASASLLSYVSGISSSLAKGIVRHRNVSGEFRSRQELFSVMGFGPKTFEQAAGFLRIPESQNPLDNTAVHPEAYSIVEKMAAQQSLSVIDFIGRKENIQKINLADYVTDDIGLPTLQDISKELLKPGRDPRAEGAKQSYSREVRDFSQLKEGQVLVGTVTNVTNFGAFVDIGVHQDGLIHISELSENFVKDPAQAVQIGEQVKVKVIAVDQERKRISLSRRACLAEGVASKPTQSGTGQTQEKKDLSFAKKNYQSHEKRSPQPRSQNRSKEPEQHSTLLDLLNKFNSSRV